MAVRIKHLIQWLKHRNKDADSVWVKGNCVYVKRGKIVECIDLELIRGK